MQYSGYNSERINNVDIKKPLFSIKFEGKLEKNLSEANIISNLLSKSISMQIKWGDYTYYITYTNETC